MGIEIERKFLVNNDNWKIGTQGELIRQGYLSLHPARNVRVRIEDDQAYMTIKGSQTGISRKEWEYSIPVEDAEDFLENLCEKPLIEKRRYRISYEGMLWEVDEFFGDNAGLVIAEIELESEDQQFKKPGWIGDEVTYDSHYYNANLIQYPYAMWKNKKLRS